MSSRAQQITTQKKKKTLFICIHCSLFIAVRSLQCCSFGDHRVTLDNEIIWNLYRLAQSLSVSHCSFCVLGELISVYVSSANRPQFWTSTLTSDQDWRFETMQMKRQPFSKRSIQLNSFIRVFQILVQSICMNTKTCDWRIKAAWCHGLKVLNLHL